MTSVMQVQLEHHLYRRGHGVKCPAHAKIFFKTLTFIAADYIWTFNVLIM